MKRRWMTLLLGGMLCVPVSRAAEVRGVKVESRDGQQADPAIVSTYTSVKVGEELSARAVARDLKALQESGRFAYVETRVDPVPGGVELVYVIELKPILRSLRVTGADQMGNDKVKGLLELEERRDRVDDAVMAAAVVKVKERYRKRYFPSPDFAWEIKIDHALGAADVVLNVDEGRRAKIKRIVFTGNHSVSSKALRKSMLQKQANLLSYFTKSGTFNPDELKLDRELVRQKYLDEGFLDVDVAEPVVEEFGKTGLRITFSITENSRYTVRSLSLEGVTLFPVEEVRKALTIGPGGVASVAAIQKSADAVKDYFGSRGYMRTTVESVLDPDRAASTVGVTYRVKEGSLAYVRNILIRGNGRTKDKVIRRELAIYPGQVFDEVKVRRSERRLQNLGYFSTVLSLPQPTEDPAKYDLAFELEEKKTGQFVVGAGFSSVDDLIGFFEISQGNFDIKGWPHFTGAGQKIKLRAQLGTSRSDFELDFTEPWFLDRKLSLGLSLFRSDKRYLSDDYDQRNTGGSVSLGKQIWGPNRGILRYSLENIEVYDVEETASEAIKEEEGERIKSALTLDLIHDSRDSVFVATRGNRSSLTSQLAGGPLGGETDLYMLEAQSSQYVPLWFEHVFNLRGWISVVESYGDADRVPIFDRLFLGGARTLRGFEYRDVGPKDENEEPIGGNSAWYATAEYTIPLASKFRIATFFDIGNVYDESYDFDFSQYNSDWGVGVRLDLPQFPLRLDYAWPLETDEFNDDGGQFNFLLGYAY